MRRNHSRHPARVSAGVRPALPKPLTRYTYLYAGILILHTRSEFQRHFLQMASSGGCVGLSGKALEPFTLPESYALFRDSAKQFVGLHSVC